MNDNAKIGTALLGLGCLFIVLGVVFFFDRMFLSLGNVMFLGGLLPVSYTHLTLPTILLV